jgi:hypothetical protein
MLLLNLKHLFAPNYASHMYVVVYKVYHNLQFLPVVALCASLQFVKDLSIFKAVVPAKSAGMNTFN